MHFIVLCSEMCGLNRDGKWVAVEDGASNYLKNGEISVLNCSTFIHLDFNHSFSRSVSLSLFSLAFFAWKPILQIDNGSFSLPLSPNDGVEVLDF